MNGEDRQLLRGSKAIAALSSWLAIVALAVLLGAAATGVRSVQALAAFVIARVPFAPTQLVDIALHLDIAVWVLVNYGIGRRRRPPQPD